MKKEIVYTDKYALILSDEEIIDNYFFNIVSKSLSQSNGTEIFDYRTSHQVNFKITAYLPLTDDAPILEGVPLLPSFSWSQQDDVDFHFGELRNVDVDSFYAGYDKAKEKYNYTEEDILKAWNAAYIDALAIDEINYKPLFFENFIQSLQQPSRPTHFECEMEVVGITDDGVSSIYEIKTTTNSQGQIELVGKYL
jgi:hypothetical protein